MHVNISWNNVPKCTWKHCEYSLTTPNRTDFVWKGMKSCTCRKPVYRITTNLTVGDFLSCSVLQERKKEKCNIKEIKNEGNETTEGQWHNKYEFSAGVLNFTVTLSSTLCL
jgi:hypothetical protein